MAEAPEETVDELYGAPAGEFISVRDARAKDLRSSDRAAADAVKKLRKPSVSAAAVNGLARESPDHVEALLAAGEALRQAQLGGGDRDAVRSAAHDEREAVEKLVEAAGKLSPSALEEVRETLHAAASDDEVRELVRRGVLAEARRSMGFAPFAGSAPAKAPARAKAPGRRRADAPKADAEARRAREEEAERRRAAKERVKAARAALRDAQKAARAAEKAVKQAEREAKGAREEVDRREKELEAAEEEVSPSPH